MIKKFKVEINVIKTLSDKIVLKLEIDDNNPEVKDLLTLGMSYWDIAEKFSDNQIDNLIKQDNMDWDSWECQIKELPES